MRLRLTDAQVVPPALCDVEIGKLFFLEKRISLDTWTNYLKCQPLGLPVRFRFRVPSAYVL
jgi:hypothetical protein